MTVSVILPIFKVEPFIERCVRSLMEQTFEDVEFIFVDDASPDNSVNLAKHVVSEYNRNVKFITHPVNKGLPGARNTGLAEATGEFIYHCDSDDWLEPDLLEKMVKAANDNNADFVYCDFYLSFSEKERYMSQPHYTDKFDALQKGVLTGNMKHNVWNKLIKHELYICNNIKSPEEYCNGGGGGEDFMIVKLLRLAEKVAHVPQALYHYNRTNVHAITKMNSHRDYEDIKNNADDIIAFLIEHPIPEPVFINYFKLDVKLPFLMDRSREQYRRWKAWYPESNKYIVNNSYQSLRTRFVELLAKWGFFSMVRLYGWTVDRLFYGIFYK